MLTALRRDLALAARHAGDLAQIVAFFVLAVMLFPFGVGPEPNLLARIASGVLWVAALLAATLSFDRLFQADHEDGSLDQMALSPCPLAFLVLAKAAAHWLTTGLPLVLLSAPLAVVMNLERPAIGPLVLAMALGTPSLSLFGAVGAALTLGARRSSALIPLLVLPLVLPVLIFGVGAVEGAATGVDSRAPLLVLAAILAAAIGVAPPAAALALREAVRAG
jgi:heme exporter protein B